MGKKCGFTLVELMVVIAIIAVIAAIALPNLIEARKGANESAAIGALRTVYSAECIFHDGDKDHNGTLDFASQLAMLASANLIDPSLGKIQSYYADPNYGNLGASYKQGYVFVIMNPPGSSGGWNPVYEFACGATPRILGETGDRVFYIDTSGVIRFSTYAGSWTSDASTWPAIGQ